MRHDRWCSQFPSLLPVPETRRRQTQHRDPQQASNRQLGDPGHMILGDVAAYSAQETGDVMRKLFIVYGLVFGLVTAVAATVTATTIEAQTALADTAN
jgi:hypothetical protein